MPEALNTEPIPLETDSEGVVRVSGTHITLDTVTAEEIVQKYPSLSLADAYQVIGYCLRHPSELDTYLARRSQSIQEIRRSMKPVGCRREFALDC